MSLIKAVKVAVLIQSHIKDVELMLREYYATPKEQCGIAHIKLQVSLEFINAMNHLLAHEYHNGLLRLQVNNLTLKFNRAVDYYDSHFKPE